MLMRYTHLRAEDLVRSTLETYCVQVWPKCDQQESIHVLLSPFESHMREVSVRIVLI